MATAKKSTAKSAPAKQAAPSAASSGRPTKKPAAKQSAAPVPHVHPPAPVHPDVPAPRGVSKDGIAYTKDFDVKFLKAQRDALEAERARLLGQATRLEDEAHQLIEEAEMGDVQFDDEGGEGDTMVVQRDLDRVLSTQARQTILEIDAALARIEQGTYGYSEVSGMPIQRERLEAIPETTVLAAEKVSGVGPR
jgi:RNA polymerase-binding transcription factor DksA